MRFDSVTFHYGKDGGVIDDLTFEMNPGEKIGIVGRFGASKTTLMLLLLRLYDVEKDRVSSSMTPTSRASRRVPCAETSAS